MRAALSKRQSKLVFLLAGLVLVLLCAGIIAFIHFMSPPKETTDPARYVSIRKDWLESGLIGHFPVTNPSNAKDVRMSAYPGFLQGGAHFQLSVRLPADEVSALMKKYSELATHRFQGGDRNDHANQPKGVPTTYSYTNGKSAGAFPESYTILVLSAKDRSSGSWNHGESCGLAIDPSDATVVYWAESW